jgi:hypothetical protein
MPQDILGRLFLLIGPVLMGRKRAAGKSIGSSRFVFLQEFGDILDSLFLLENLDMGSPIHLPTARIRNPTADLRNVRLLD